MKLLTGLFRLARKRVQTTDTDMGAFRDKITELVEKKDSLSDDGTTGTLKFLDSWKNGQNSVNLPWKNGQKMLK